jgi:MFS family permease
MGRVSDHYGRRFVMLVCLTASTLNYFFLSHAQSLVSVVLARLISASFGGLLPIIQSTVADIVDVEHRPKFLGRIMATFGLGFVLGPAISAALPFYSTEQKIFLASALPALGLVIMLLFGQETKKERLKGKKVFLMTEHKAEGVNAGGHAINRSTSMLANKRKVSR